MAYVTDWAEFAPYFTESELACSHTGECFMNDVFMRKLLAIRKVAGFPMPITSGYRAAAHPIEASKPKPGEHAEGVAVDVGVSGAQALRLIEVALSMGIKRIGIAQKGQGRFVHLGGSLILPSPAIWTY